MQITVNISDENSAEIATAFGYQPIPLDPSDVSDQMFIQQKVTEYIRQTLLNYRVRVAANTAMNQQVSL